MANRLPDTTAQALGHLMVILITPDDVLQKSAMERDYPDYWLKVAADFTELYGEKQLEISTEVKHKDTYASATVTSRHSMKDGIPNITPGVYYAKRTDRYVGEDEGLVGGSSGEVYAIADLPRLKDYALELTYAMQIFEHFEVVLKNKFES